MSLYDVNIFLVRIQFLFYILSPKDVFKFTWAFKMAVNYAQKINFCAFILEFKSSIHATG